MKLTILNFNHVNPQKLLEIGPAEGYNFEFYPDNTLVTAIDYNKNFEKIFIENLNKYKQIELDHYHIGSVENMSKIEDNTMDVVLTTYVLGYARNQDEALKEIIRVLKPVCHC